MCCITRIDMRKAQDADRLLIYNAIDPDVSAAGPLLGYEEGVIVRSELGWGFAVMECDGRYKVRTLDRDFPEVVHMAGHWHGDCPTHRAVYAVADDWFEYGAEL